MPRDPVGEAQTLQWTIAALNSMEMVTVPWWSLKMTGGGSDDLTGGLGQRHGHVERILGERPWLAGDHFTLADLLMADGVRLQDLPDTEERLLGDECGRQVRSRGA